MNDTVKIKSWTPAEWAAFAVNHLAYVKRVVDGDAAGWAIHAADGTPLAVLADRDTAFAAVRQHDLEPVSVH
jgi:hypothetical protein